MKKLVFLLVVAVLAFTTVAYASYSSGSCTAGSFSVSFSNADFVTGLGWSTGSGGTISFSGWCSGCDFGPGVYGWKTNPLVEYYIGKGGGSTIGSYSCNGHNYTFKVLRRYNAPSIQGTADFDQYNADGSSSSPVSFGCHSYHWQRLGKPSGTHNYQVVSVESWHNTSGSASVSVSNSNWYTHWVGSGSASFSCGGGGGSTTTTNYSTTTTSGGGGGYYLVRNRSTNGCVTNNSSSSNGADIRYTSCNSSYYSQQWQRNDRGSGYYTFINRSSGKAMRGTNGDVVQYTYYSNYWTEMWKREYGSSGYYHYRNRSTNTCMRAGGGDIYLSGCNSGYWSEMFILQ